MCYLKNSLNVKVKVIRPCAVETQNCLLISKRAHYYFPPPPVGMQSIVIGVFVCLFVCQLAYLKNRTSKFHVISFACYAWPWLEPPLQWRQCDVLCTSGFVDDVMFSRNRANGPNQKRRVIYVSPSSPAGGTGGEVCCLGLPLVSVSCAALLDLPITKVYGDLGKGR